MNNFVSSSNGLQAFYAKVRRVAADQCVATEVSR